VHKPCKMTGRVQSVTRPWYKHFTTRSPLLPLESERVRVFTNWSRTAPISLRSLLLTVRFYSQHMLKIPLSCASALRMSCLFAFQCNVQPHSHPFHQNPRRCLVGVGTNTGGFDANMINRMALNTLILHSSHAGVAQKPPGWPERQPAPQTAHGLSEQHP